MNLNQLLVNQRNVDQLSAQFGLSQQETVNALSALLPAFSEGLKRQTATPQGAAGLIEALAGGGHAQYAQDPRVAVSNEGIQDGQAILGHLFGNKDVSRAVASHASGATGIGSSVLKSMLPAIASMVMGSLFKGATRGGGGGLGGMLGNALGGAGGSGGLGGMLGQAAGGGLLGTLIEGLAGGVLGGAKQPARRRAPRRRGRQTSNSIEDILGQVLGGGGGAARQAPMPRSRSGSRRAQRRQNPAGDGLGGLLDELMGGTPSGRQGRQGRYRDPVDPRAQAPRRRQAQRRRPQRRRGGLQDIFGDMLEPGNQTSREYQRQTGSVFDEFLGE